MYKSVWKPFTVVYMHTKQYHHCHKRTVYMQALLDANKGSFIKHNSNIIPHWV